MNTIRTAGSIALGAALLVGCAERSIPTASRAVVLDAAAGLTSIVTDPVGDVKSKYPAYLDIVQVAITRKDRSFTLTTDLAGSVPTDPAADPVNSSGLDFLNVALFGLDSDPTTSPVGYPFPAKEQSARPFEFFVVVSWNPTGSFGLGTGFVGFVIDRRPLLTGGEAVVTPVPFTIDGSRVTVTVDARLLGDPATFQWGAATVASKHPAPTEEFDVPDLAPDAGLPLVTWPQ